MGNFANFTALTFEALNTGVHLFQFWVSTVAETSGSGPAVNAVEVLLNGSLILNLQYPYLISGQVVYNAYAGALVQGTSYSLKLVTYGQYMNSYVVTVSG